MRRTGDQTKILTLFPFAIQNWIPRSCFGIGIAMTIHTRLCMVAGRERFCLLSCRLILYQALFCSPDSSSPRDHLAQSQVKMIFFKKKKWEVIFNAMSVH